MSECLVLGAVGEQEDVVLLAPILKLKTDLESVNKDTPLFLDDTIFKYFTNLVLLLLDVLE
jgi:hypothetical protein